MERSVRGSVASPVEFERVSHDEAWGCAYSRVWRAYLETGRAVTYPRHFTPAGPSIAPAA